MPHAFALPALPPPSLLLQGLTDPALALVAALPADAAELSVDQGRNLSDALKQNEPLIAATLGLGALLVITALFRHQIKRSKQKQRARERATNRDEHPTGPAEAASRSAADPTGPHRQRLDSLMVEVQELTRVCAAQVENRATRLETLLRDADDLVRRLEAATRQAEAAAERAQAPAVARQHARPQAVGPTRHSRTDAARDELLAGAYDDDQYDDHPSHDDDDFARAHAPATVAAAGARSSAALTARAHAERRNPNDVPVEPLTVRVAELADAGLSAPEIARHLGEQIGKVELILALRSAS